MARIKASEEKIKCVICLAPTHTSSAGNKCMVCKKHLKTWYDGEFTFSIYGTHGEKFFEMKKGNKLYVIEKQNYWETLQYQLLAYGDDNDYGDPATEMLLFNTYNKKYEMYYTTDDHKVHIRTIDQSIKEEDQWKKGWYNE